MEHSSGEHKVYTFAPGPPMLPKEILVHAQKELLDYKGTGISLLETSHRSKEFDEIMATSKANLRKLLNIPANFQVFYLQGGATLGMAAVPMNLLKGKTKANYIATGHWSRQAVVEAARYCTVVESCVGDGTTIPDESTWKIDPEGAYVYYCDNETIHGVEFAKVPDSKGQVLVCDMTSNLCTRALDFTKYGVIVAGAQKNCGPAGVTIVIIREDLVNADVLKCTPVMCNFKSQIDMDSRWNTPPTFSIYLMNLYLEYLIKEGGVDHWNKLSIEKSKLLYDVIDESHGFYTGFVKDKQYRSRMNVVFRIKNDEKLEDAFVAEAKAQGLVELKGHKVTGGIRASIYNGMPKEGVAKLAALMKDFQKRHSA